MAAEPLLGSSLSFITFVQKKARAPGGTGPEPHWEKVAAVTRATKQSRRAEGEGEGMPRCWAGIERARQGVRPESTGFSSCFETRSHINKQTWWHSSYVRVLQLDNGDQGPRKSPRCEESVTITSCSDAKAITRIK